MGRLGIFEGDFEIVESFVSMFCSNVIMTDIAEEAYVVIFETYH